MYTVACGEGPLSDTLLHLVHGDVEVVAAHAQVRLSEGGDNGGEQARPGHPNSARKAGEEMMGSWATRLVQIPHLRPVTGNPPAVHTAHVFLFSMAPQGQLWEPHAMRFGREPHARLLGSLTPHAGRWENPNLQHGSPLPHG